MKGVKGHWQVTARRLTSWQQLNLEGGAYEPSGPGQKLAQNLAPPARGRVRRRDAHGGRRLRMALSAGGGGASMERRRQHRGPRLKLRSSSNLPEDFGYLTCPDLT